MLPLTISRRQLVHYLEMLAICRAQGVGRMSWLPASTHNDRLLGWLDGETVSLDRGTGAGEVGLLVLALDLKRSAWGTSGAQAAAAVDVARLVQEDK